MRFIFGVFVGAALMLGSAYLHDTGVVKAGPQAAVRELGHRVRDAGAVSPASELLHPRPQLDLLRPGAARLLEHMQIARAMASGSSSESGLSGGAGGARF